ncbi:hypothetical protein ACG7TL_006429 [Trametes sanguinea]
MKNPSVSPERRYPQGTAAALVQEHSSSASVHHISQILSTLTAKLNLPYPRALFELSYFRFNPIPLYTLARELYPGRYRPTLTHTFIRLLSDRGSLHTCYTENIDALERQAGVPPDRLVEPHGSLATQCCVNCQAPYDREKMKIAVEKGEPAHCESCDGLVKPGVELHGELRFTEKWQELQNADLLFVIGTSLTIPPFAPLATLVPQECPRVLIHMDFAGDIGMRSDDVLLLGKCDDIVRDLCKELGWEDTLMQEWAKTEGESAPSVALHIDAEADVDVDGTGSIAAFDGSPPGETMGPDDTNEFGVMADAEWQEKEPKADSLTERLRTALEHSEKPSAYVPDPGITFVARSLSGEELFADPAVDHPSRPGDVPAADGCSVLVG